MKTISVKDLQPQEKPGNGWYIIDSVGEHPGSHSFGGQRVQFVQHLTPEALARVVAAGVPAEGLFIDKDHCSLDARGSTEAYGWLRELALCRLRPEGDSRIVGLAGRIEWTPLGLPLIETGIYKHFSTVYPPNEAQMRAGSFEPAELAGLALTNMPNNEDGQPPITNRKHTPLLPPTTGSENQTQTNEKNNMEYPAKLLAALGLAEGATEEEVITAAEGMAAKAARCDEAEQAANEAVNAEADATITAAAKEAGVELTEEEEKEVKEELLANRKHGLRFLNLLCNSKRSQQAAPGARRYAGARPEVNNSLIANSRQKKESDNTLNQRAHELCREAAAEGRTLSFSAARALAAREPKH